MEKLLNANHVSNSDNFIAWLLKAITVIDLTTLSGDDTRSNVRRLCLKAINPLSKDLEVLTKGSNVEIRTAAVCVYPNRVADAFDVIQINKMIDIVQIASVATGFPAGLYPLKSRLLEIEYAVSQGANEIDIVLDRSLVLTGKWKEVFFEVQQMKTACGEAHMKVILGVGELGTMNNIYKASMVSMFAGADFIKTSTGKEAVNATLPIGLVMCRAIRNYYHLTGRKVGLKPAGGIKTPVDAVNWLILVKNELGDEWLTPKLFRIGASSLLNEIESHLYKYVLNAENV